MFAAIRHWSRVLKQDLYAISLAVRDPRTPWYARALGIAVAAYALSPIDLIPDFIPVLGYLDEIIIVPLGLALMVKLIPAEVLTEHRAIAKAAGDPQASLVGAIVIVVICIAAAAIAAWFGYRWWYAT